MSAANYLPEILETTEAERLATIPAGSEIRNRK